MARETPANDIPSPRRRLHEDSGAGMVEYALLVLLVAVALLGAVGLLAAGLMGSFADSAAQL